MESAEPSQVSPRPRFPALDPEPPPRPWRRVGAALVVFAVAGLSSWLGYAVSGQRTADHKAAVSVPVARGLTGVVLSEAPGSFLSATDMQTGKVAVFRNFGQFSSNPDPAVSADGRYLLDVAVGRFLSLSVPGHPEAAANALSFSTGDMPGFMADPWSDHDTSVVELSYPVNGQGFQATIAVAEVESVRTGNAVSLGPADSAAGDPQHAGAFIAVPAIGKTLTNGFQPDARLILADAGAPSRVLATTAELNYALGNKPGTPLSISPIPNPQGSMVAVEVSSTTDGASGMVVLSRSGKVLGSEPGGGVAVAWSHSGAVLAFTDPSGGGAELTEWKIGVQSVTTTLDDATAPPDACAWSPDDVSVVCDDGPRGRWLVIRSDTESVTAGQGQPLAWVSGRPGT
jgi:hypothetical protein